MSLVGGRSLLDWFATGVAAAGVEVLGAHEELFSADAAAGLLFVPAAHVVEEQWG